MKPRINQFDPNQLSWNRLKSISISRFFIFGVNLQNRLQMTRNSIDFHGLPSTAAICLLHQTAFRVPLADSPKPISRQFNSIRWNSLHFQGISWLLQFTSTLEPWKHQSVTRNITGIRLHFLPFPHWKPFKVHGLLKIIITVTANDQEHEKSDRLGSPSGNHRKLAIVSLPPDLKASRSVEFYVLPFRFSSGVNSSPQSGQMGRQLLVKETDSSVPFRDLCQSKPLVIYMTLSTKLVLVNQPLFISTPREKSTWNHLQFLCLSLGKWPNKTIE